MGSAARIEPAGQTVDMLRNRADMADPKENKKLYALIEQRGAIITDLPLGRGRNAGVVVAEDAQYSGLLIPARLAMELGPAVFGASGSATRPPRLAPNQLIRTAAKPVTTREEIVEELRTSIHRELFSVETTTAKKRASLFERPGGQRPGKQLVRYCFEVARKTQCVTRPRI
jgi:predicted Rossmann fold nucleotide-binding protein DprA/Smf involved in DNA uptake